MKIKKVLLYSLILFFSLMGLALQAHAVPPMSHNFYGYVSDEGNVKIAGATITVTLNDSTEPTEINEPGKGWATTATTDVTDVGYYDFNFKMDDPDTSDVVEGARKGDVVHIYINNVESNETRSGGYKIDEGGFNELNLTIPDELGPTTSDVKTDASTSLSIPEGNASVTLTASVTDVGKGGNNIKAAEYFTGTAGDNGTGTAMAASDGAFSSATEAVTATVDTASWTATGSPYTLLVRGQDSKDNWGATATVQVTVYKAPDAPTLTDVAAKTKDQTPTFDWNDVTDAATYTIEVSTQNDFSTTVIQDATLTASTYTAATDLAEGTYYWRVRATDAAAHAGAWATGNSFVIDITPPAVAIDAVTTPTATTTQTITGTVEAGATVTAAVDTAAVAGAATFPTTTTYSIEVTGLVKDSNVITVTATDQAGNAATAQATIDYHPAIAVTPSGNVYVPVTVPGYTQAFNITGGSGTFSWALDTEAYGTLTSATGVTNTFTPVADTPGDAVLTITDTVYTEKTPITVNIHAVEFGMTPTTGLIAVGDTIDIEVVGAVGTVTWTVNTPAVGSVGTLTGTHSEKGVFTGSAAGITTITVTDGGEAGTGASMTSGNFEVIDPVTVTPAATVMTDEGTLQINITGGKGTKNSDYTLTLTPAEVGTITADGLFTPAAGDGVRKFTVTAADKTYTTFTGQSAEIAVVDPLVITGKPAGDVMETASNNTFTFTGGSGAVTWTASAGSITEAGVFTAPTVTEGTVDVDITATDSAYNTITATAEVVVYGTLGITLPEGYDENNAATWKLITKDTTIVAGGGNPAEAIVYSIKDSTGADVAGVIGAADGVINANALLANGAGVYTVMASKTGSTAVGMKVRVPMKLTPMEGSFTDKSPNQDFVITGATANLAWYITDEAGEEIAAPSFGNFTDPAVTGATATFNFTEGIETVAFFKVLVESSDQALIDAGIDTVETEIMFIKPVIELDIQVDDAATDAGIAGAVIKAKHDQTITATTDAEGAATIALGNTGVTYEFAVTAAGYLPATFTATDLNTAVTVEMTAITTAGTISGTVTPAGEGITVTAKNAAGDVIEDGSDNPLTVFADATTGAFDFTFDTATAGAGPYKIAVERFGFVDVSGNNGEVANKNAGDTDADVTMAPATIINITDDGGSPTLTYSVSATPAFTKAVNSEIQLSVGTEAQATPLDGSALTFAGGVYTYGVTAPEAGAAASIYVQADTSTTARDAAAGFKAAKTYTVVGGVTTTAPVVKNISDPSLGGEVESTNGKATLPPSGVKTLNAVSLSVSEASTVTTTAGSAVIFDVNLFYSGTGEKVDNSLIEKVYITISFDPTKVETGSLESGDVPILQAASISDMAAGTASEVPTAQIVSTDYTAGKVTFWVDHLSVFGIGAEEEDPGPGPAPSVADDDDCFIATAAYGSLFEPQVKTLRQFRDRYLLTNRLGTGFVKMYYRFSPPVAKVIADHEGLRFATRVGLTPLIGMSYVMIHTSPVQKIIILIMMAGLVVSLYRMRRRSVAARV